MLQFLLCSCTRFTLRNCIACRCRQEQAHRLIRRLGQIGMTCNTHADVVGTLQQFKQSYGFYRYLEVKMHGLQRDCSTLFNLTFPILEKMYSDLEHPIAKDWRPKPHLDVLENIGRSFSTSLVERSSLQRWLGSLSVATPYSMDEYRRKEESRCLEETPMVAALPCYFLVSPLNEQECKYLETECIGTSSKATLPLPKASKIPRDVLTLILQACDWEELFGRTKQYDASVGAVQHWIQSIDSLLQHDSSIEFVDLYRLASEQTKAPKNRVDHPDVKICTPVEAYGMESDVTMFVGLDAESWSMKPERIP